MRKVGAVLVFFLIISAIGALTLMTDRQGNIQGPSAECSLLELLAGCEDAK